MSVEINLDNLNLSANHIIRIYKMFCVAYKIEFREDDKKFFEHNGLEYLNSFGGLDYRPYMGGKFFGQKFGNVVRFHGYSSPEDPKYEKKDKDFQKLVEEYFR